MSTEQTPGHPENSESLKKAERKLRAKIKGFRAGDRMARDQVHDEEAQASGILAPENTASE
jgi:hypothetical protein